ncbi:MAG: hypothetical protein PG981_000864 [Wolbachia endosymbiont of Ctenocephalides orientis wCori]|nr:MAG: hypothetical protein PG981_000864 [Wolbachia endosymbiont of Ctenocephalides orientis wCori]
MNKHYKLTGQEFYDNDAIFGILEIRAEQVVGKGYQDLNKLLKKQHTRLILVNHPDKGGDKDRFYQIHKAYQELKKYIEPLESGSPRVKISIDEESDWRLTAREFRFRKLFAELNITQEEAVGKNLGELISILENKDHSFKQALEQTKRLTNQIRKVSQDQTLGDFERRVEIGRLTYELSKQLKRPIMQLFTYLIPLEKKKNLVEEDKKKLALKFIERKNALLLIQTLSIIPLALLATITIGCYFSWWIIAFKIVSDKACDALVSHYMEKYKNSEISADEFINEMNYIQLGRKLLLNYPLVASSIYLLSTNFIANGLTICGVILASLMTLAILIEVLAPIFSKGCDIYTEKHTKDLLEEDSRDRVQKATDLLKWYDLRRLLMPIIMLLVEKCFVGLANELAGRNLSTGISEVSTEQPIQYEAIEFAPQVN